MKAIACWNYDTDVLDVPDKLYIVNFSQLALFTV